MDTYLPSHKAFKYDEQETLDTVGEVMMNSKAMFSYGLCHVG